MESSTKSGKKGNTGNRDEIAISTIASEEPASQGNEKDLARNHERDHSYVPFGDMTDGASLLLVFATAVDRL